MAAKITELTDAQWAQMAPWAARWVADALDPRPADRALVEDGMRRCYEFAGLPWHGRVIWVDSPIVATIVGPLLAMSGDGVGAGVGDGVWDGVRDGVRAGVRDGVWDGVGAGVWDGVRDGVRAGWCKYLGGAFWASWPAYTSFMRDVVGVELDGDLWDRDRAYADAQSAGWWWPHRDYIIVSERHTSISRDTQGRLHSTTGPAITWGDEWAIYALDGIRVPAWVIDDPTPARILAELPNTEQRRVALAHYGWDRAVEDLALDVIDTADDPTWGTLYRLPDEIGDGQATLLVAQNASPDRDGTVRTYGLLAAADCRTVVAAQASLAQLSEAEWLALDGAS